MFTRTNQRVKGGQSSDLAFFEQPLGNFTFIKNCIPTAEGLIPLQSLCDPVGPTWNLLTAPVFSPMGGPITVIDASGLPTMILNIDNTVAATTKLSIMHQLVLNNTNETLHDHHSTVLSYPANLAYAALPVGFNNAAVSVESLMAQELIRKGVHYGTRYLIVTDYNDTATAKKVAGGVILDADFNTLPPSSTVTPVIDVDGAGTAIPAPELFLANDEYLLALGGLDYYTGTAAIHYDRLRWSHPAAYNRWKPSTTVPPSNLAGYKVMQNGRIIDAVVFLGSVYVFATSGIYRMNRVGGSVGYTLQTLGIESKLAYGSVHSAVPTANGIYLITDDGLYLFNGLQMTAVSAGISESLFTREFLSVELGDTLYTPINSSTSTIRSLHCPVVDSILWFVVVSAPVATIKILGYNYETKEAFFLEPPANEIWWPMDGQEKGLAVYDKTAKTIRCFALRPNKTNTTPPDASIEVKSGYMSLENANRVVFLERLFFGLSAIANTNIWSGASIVIYIYDQERKLIETRPFGLMRDGFPRNFIDVRASGRFLQIGISGTPSTWMNYATASIMDLASTLASISVTGKGLGYRS